MLHCVCSEYVKSNFDGDVSFHRAFQKPKIPVSKIPFIQRADKRVEFQPKNLTRGV